MPTTAPSFFSSSFFHRKSKSTPKESAHIGIHYGLETEQTSSKRSKKHGERKSRPRSVYTAPPVIQERDSSLYSSNYAAASASVGYLPLAPPRAQFYSQHAYSTVELSRPAQYQPPRKTVPPASRRRSSVVGFVPDQWERLIQATNLSLRTKTGADGSDDPSYKKPVRHSAYLPPSNTSSLTSSPSVSSFHLPLRMSARETMVQHDAPSHVLWSSPELDDMAPPPVPARSRLRPAANITASSISLSAPMSDRHATTSYALPMRDMTVALPLAQIEDVPSLTSDSSSEHEHEHEPMPRSPIIDFSWGRKKRAVPAIDSKKIRDGLTPKESSSGVYTPMTFAGPQGSGSQPHSPGGVYTPPTFTLFPVQPDPPAGPSRSPSMSSSGSGSDTSVPRTPQTPSSRFGAAMSGLSGIGHGFKRISSSITSHGQSNARAQASFNPEAGPAHSAQQPGRTLRHVSQHPPHSARDFSQHPLHSARDSYFPPISAPAHPTHTRTASWSPSSVPAPPNSYGSGLGLGLPSPTPGTERDGRANVSGSASGSGSGSLVSPRIVSDEKKGRRKPVPRVDVDSTRSSSADGGANAPELELEAGFRRMAIESRSHAV